MGNLTAEDVREYFSYDKLTGELVRLKSDSRRHIHSLPAVVKLSAKAYTEVMVKGVAISAHRLVWLYVTGELPGPEWRIDHEDRDITNIRWSNLRKIPPGANIRNQLQIGKRTRSGITGVSFVKAKEGTSKPWSANIRIDGKLYHLGYFASLEEAAEARCVAHEKEMQKIKSVYQVGVPVEGFVPNRKKVAICVNIVGEFKF